MKHPFTIVGLGEILWDVFPDGPRFGGAPANFACTAAGLGRKRTAACMVSRVGQDELGTRAIDELQKRGVDTSCVSIGDYPTGQVLVEIDEAGRASYRFADNTAWDHLVWSSDLEPLAARTDAVCFGTLGQRSGPSRETIQRFVSGVPRAALRIFDVNLRPPYVSDPVILQSLALANILKLNDEELPVLAGLCELSGSEIELIRRLADRFDLRMVALTRGPGGALLVRGAETSECRAATAPVVDTVGAGDAFTAALAVGLLNGNHLDTINRAAGEVAAFVCSQSGATPVIRDALKFVMR